MTEDKKLKVVFAPGCFDSFDGTQEELDNLIKEIEERFDGKTKEEMEFIGNPIDPDDLPPEVLAALAEQLFDAEELAELEQMGMPRKRNLQ